MRFPDYGMFQSWADVRAYVWWEITNFLRKPIVWFWSVAIIGMLTVLALNLLAQQSETELVRYDVVKIACKLPDGCELTPQEEGKGRPLTLRCRNGCVIVAQDTVVAQTSLRSVVFTAVPDSSDGTPDE